MHGGESGTAGAGKSRGKAERQRREKSREKRRRHPKLTRGKFAVAAGNGTRERGIFCGKEWRGKRFFGKMPEKCVKRSFFYFRLKFKKNFFLKNLFFEKV